MCFDFVECSGWVRVFNISIMFVNIVLSAWLLCVVGCLMCVFRLYRQLRQSVNIYASSFGYFLDINLNVLWMAISSARKHVCSPGNLFALCMFVLVGLYISYHVFSFFQCLSAFWVGGMKEPSI